jgi:hypothetical protein
VYINGNLWTSSPINPNGTVINGQLPGSTVNVTITAIINNIQIWPSPIFVQQLPFTPLTITNLLFQFLDTTPSRTEIVWTGGDQATSYSFSSAPASQAFTILANYALSSKFISFILNTDANRTIATTFTVYAIGSSTISASIVISPAVSSSGGLYSRTSRVLQYWFPTLSAQTPAISSYDICHFVSGGIPQLLLNVTSASYVQATGVTLYLPDGVFSPKIVVFARNGSSGYGPVIPGNAVYIKVFVTPNKNITS